MAALLNARACVRDSRTQKMCKSYFLIKILYLPKCFAKMSAKVQWMSAKVQWMSAIVQ